jgi:hypothetical protein
VFHCKYNDCKVFVRDQAQHEMASLRHTVLHSSNTLSDLKPVRNSVTSHGVAVRTRMQRPCWLVASSCACANTMCNKLPSPTNRRLIMNELIEWPILWVLYARAPTQYATSFHRRRAGAWNWVKKLREYVNEFIVSLLCVIMHVTCNDKTTELLCVIDCFQCTSRVMVKRRSYCVWLIVFNARHV